MLIKHLCQQWQGLGVFLCTRRDTAGDVGALELLLDPKSKQSRVDNSRQQGPLKGPK